MLRNILIVVDDIEKSVRFYKELFGLPNIAVKPLALAMGIQGDIHI